MTKNLKEYQYLNNYEPLKKYVEDMKASGKCNPDFKLGIALAAPDFNKQELVYCLAGSNFEEMTAGNAMKYASCVKMMEPLTLILLRISLQMHRMQV